MHTPNKKSLSELANIRTGYTFRGKVEEISDGNAHLLQIKDARLQREENKSDIIDAPSLPQINWEGKQNAFVDSGTVLLPARGGYFRSSLFTGGDSLPIVASSQFILITPYNDTVVPEFLCWSLNRPLTQRYLEDIASQGSNISMLSTATVKDLKIEIPSVETQFKILHINKLWEEEQKLTQALLNNREIMLQGMFQQLLKENK
ncbi:restriction endonuclease subunit S [Bermanella sp. R86510]|uniref:restriction endonuclease subunit S n=1 Tax=unclassified Bermanella TaxID=2627862 RepID=UPI0037CC73FD